MRVFTTFVSLFALIGFGATGWTNADAVNTAKTAAEDMSRVSEIRRLLRSACKELKMATENPENADTILTSSAEKTAQTLDRWRDFRLQHSAKPPEVLAAHASWDSAVQEIENGIREMLNLTNARQVGSALKACGRTCSLFVDLNTKAGVRRTSDILFQFRRIAKPLADAIKSGTLLQVKDALPRLLKMRDDALTDPVGGIGSPEEKSQSLTAFSAAVDAFVQSMQQNDTDDAASCYEAMMKALERTYDLFL